MMLPAPSNTFAAVEVWLSIAGTIALMVGFGLEIAAKRYGWHYVKRALPALVVAVVLLVLLLAERRGALVPLVATSQAGRQVLYHRSCEGPFWWTDMLCW